MKKCCCAILYMAMGAGVALLCKKYSNEIMNFIDKEVENTLDMAGEKLDELKGKK